MKKIKTPRIKIWNEDVLSLSANTIENMLELNSSPNVTYSDKNIIHHVLNAISSRTSISNVSNFSPDAPSEGTIRNRLSNIELEDIQENINESLKIHPKETVSNTPHRFAADFVLIPFYGTEKNTGDTIRTKSKQGTSTFYAYSSIYLILNNKRYTLALKYIKKRDSLTDTLNFLMDEVENNGFKMKSIYLDKEFFTIDVINYLQNRKTPFIIPAVRRGSKGGIRELLKGEKSYSTEYTMQSKGKKATFQVNVVIKYSKGKYKEKGRKYFAYAVFNMNIPIKKTFTEYRQRFGIESSYKLMNQARIHTSTKKPQLKLLYIGISFLLINIWIYIQWMYLSIPRKGGRKKRTWIFKTMLIQINRSTEEKLGFKNKIFI